MIAYLTKAEFDYETAVKAGLRDSYACHQLVWKAFPNRDRQARDFLTRLDDVQSGFRLLILSQSQPVRPTWCPLDGWSESKPIDQEFLAPARFHFSLLANPTEKKVVRDAQGQRRKNGRRVPIVGQDALIDWIHRKAQQHGFSIDAETLRATSQPRRYFVKKGTAGLHAATNFRGVLQITDQDAFTQALINGIGPAKAFGFGLLCLGPA